VAVTQETVSTFSNLLKEWYTDDRVEDMAYKRNALHALLPKMTTFGGKNLPIPIVFGTTQGGSANFTTAVANKGNTKSKEFLLTRASDYSLASIGREAVLASEQDRGAFLEAAKTNIDGAIRGATRSIAIAEYRAGTGVRGQVSSGSNVATTAVTLADVNAVTNFEVGMVIQLSATNGGGAVRTGTAEIAAVNRVTGVLTFTATLSSTISAAAASDFIFRAGDYGAVLSGIDAWILPATARPSAAGTDSHFAVDRFSDLVRLAGVYHDGTGQSIEEALLDGQSKVAREGGAVDHIFINNVQYRQLMKSLGSKVMYTPTKAEATARVYFSGVEIMGDAGPIKIIPDQNCPSSTAYALQLDTWKLYSLGEAPHIFDKDTDQEMLRESGTDGYELRTGYYANLGCRAPGWNGRIELAAAV